jgi:Sec-independent protein translocase protein TatA
VKTGKMEIFGIGPLELVLIVFLALIILGPKDMVETAKKSASWLRKLRQSDAWKTTREVMDIPNQVMKETGLDKEIREINSLSQKTLSATAWDGDALSGARKAAPENGTGADKPKEIPSAPADGKESHTIDKRDRDGA